MRKTIIASNGYAFATEQARPIPGWLDLAAIAHLEMTSESGDYPVEHAFTDPLPGAAVERHHWQASEPGPQTLSLLFDKPQRIRRVLLHFEDAEQERQQEFSLNARLAGGHNQEIVRQQWTFSPGGSTEEIESYEVALEDVEALTLWIDPDRGRDRFPATLRTFRVGS